MAGSQTHRAGGQAEVGLGFSSRWKRSVCVCVCVCVCAGMEQGQVAHQVGK